MMVFQVGRQVRELQQVPELAAAAGVRRGRLWTPGGEQAKQETSSA